MYLVFCIPCKGTLNNFYQPRSQPCLATLRRVAGARRALSRGSKAEGLGAPSPASLAGNNTKTLRARSQQLGVSCTLAPLSDGDSGSFARGSRGFGASLSRLKGHEYHVAA